MRSSTIIKVRDFSFSKHFYCEILGLGEPEIIGGFGCFFRLNENGGLYLLSSASPYLEHASSASSWIWESENIEELRKRLAAAGFPLSDKLFSVGCESAYRGTDPEGNPFYVVEAKS